MNFPYHPSPAGSLFLLSKRTINFCHQECNIQNLSHTCWETQYLGFSLTLPQPHGSLPSCACFQAFGEKRCMTKPLDLHLLQLVSSDYCSNHITPGFSSMPPSGKQLDLIMPSLPIDRLCQNHVPTMLRCLLISMLTPLLTNPDPEVFVYYFGLETFTLWGV